MGLRWCAMADVEEAYVDRRVDTRPVGEHGGQPPLNCVQFMLTMKGSERIDVQPNAGTPQLESCATRRRCRPPPSAERIKEVKCEEA
jgi:hypothetical protein